MFQNKKVIQLVLSACMALLFVNFYLRGKERSIENAFGMVPVLTAARDIPPHTQLQEAYLTTQKVPTRYLQPGAFIVKIPAEALTRVKGMVTVGAIPAGAQIMQSSLKNPTLKDHGVAPLLPPGKRGYLLRLGNTDVSDLILPGDHVDVLATFNVSQNKDGGQKSKGTFTILQNILVVAVGPDLQQPGSSVTPKKDSRESAMVITLAVDPQQSGRLALAHSESGGEIFVVVRAHGDTDIPNVPGVTPGELLNNPAPAGRVPFAN